MPEKEPEELEEEKGHKRRGSQAELKHERLNIEQKKPRARYIQRNIITKYAFATRVGFVPSNPNKVN